MSKPTIRAGLVGAGYIADWHADAIASVRGVELTAVCDVSRGAAAAMAEARGIKAFGSLEEMIEAKACDAVHVVTPPHIHRALAEQSLQAGLHVFVEKPFALSREDCAAIGEAARASGRVAAVGHNFLGLPGYARLREAMRKGVLGRIDSVDISWRFPLAPLRSGPFNLWMLREPGNLLLELGPHLYAFAVDLLGPPEELQLSLSRPIELSGGGTRHQSWRILGRAGGADVAINLSLVETMDDRTVVVRGSTGIATLDYAADTLTIVKENASEIVLSPFLRQMSGAWEHVREGFINLARQVSSLNRKSPYGLGFRGSIQTFYQAVRDGSPIDPRYSAESAEKVIGSIQDTIALMPESARQDPPPVEATRSPQPSVLVIGGTGFIGRALVRALVARGRDVRVLSRAGRGPFSDLPDQVETVGASLKDREGVRRAMEGIEAVFHLAKSLDSTWEACLENDVGVTVNIAEAAMDAGVERFVYTGTIASYDMSEPTQVITEKTGFAEDMTDRNLYARSKAECEARLMAMHRERGLPLVIARPGIVVGAGGPLQHWGIGRWHGAGAIRIWGDGRNILPFVLIDDVAEGLVRTLEVEDAIGQSFNLVGEPMFTARGYFEAIEQALGAHIDVHPGWLTGFFMTDAVKYVLKRYALGRRGAIRASLRDWKSRAHYSRFDIEHAKKGLDWSPESDRDEFVRKGITEAGLFGH